MKQVLSHFHFLSISLQAGHMWGNMFNKLPIIPSYDDWGWVTEEGCQPCPSWISKPVLSKKNYRILGNCGYQSGQYNPPFICCKEGQVCTPHCGCRGLCLHSRSLNWWTCHVNAYQIMKCIGPLNHRLKGETPEAWKSGPLFSLSRLSVCPSVCSEATGHNFWLGNIIFGMRGPWDMSKKGFFPILKILIFRVKNGQKTPKYQDKAGSGPLQPRVSACLYKY